jgi:hypothetical protein
VHLGIRLASELTLRHLCGNLHPRLGQSHRTSKMVLQLKTSLLVLGVTVDRRYKNKSRKISKYASVQYYCIKRDLISFIFRISLKLCKKRKDNFEKQNLMEKIKLEEVNQKENLLEEELIKIEDNQNETLTKLEKKVKLIQINDQISGIFMPNEIIMNSIEVYKQKMLELQTENTELKERLKKYTNGDNNKRYYEKNKEKIKEQGANYLKKLAEENPEKIKEYRRTAYLKRKAKLQDA